MRLRSLTLAAALAALIAAVPGRAADPPVVFQTQPFGQFVKTAQGFMKWFPEGSFTKKDAKSKRTPDEIFAALLDPKSGLDLSKPIVGYVVVPANPDDTTVVFALPVADEKAFTAFLKDPGDTELKPVGDGVYELIARRPDGEPAKKDSRALARFHQKSFYVAVGKDPTAAIAEKALVPADKLADPAEKSFAAARVYFDRFPKELRDKAGEAVTKAVDDLHRGFAGADLGPDAKKAVEPLVKMVERYAGQIGEAQEAVVRNTVDSATGEWAVEASLVPKPGTSLARDIAGRKPGANAFAGLITPDTAVGLRVRLPFDNEELRAAAAAGLGILKGQADDANPTFQPLATEAVDGAIRTVKTGEVDLAVALRGPDRAGLFTAVGVISFDDPSKLEREIKALVKMIPPAAEKVTFGKAKAGAVEIHEIAIGDQVPPEARKVFGENMTAALAFAPKGIFFAAGPDAVAALKDAVAVKPGAAPMLDVVLNPSRTVKFAEATGGKEAGAKAAKALGTADRLAPVMSVAAAGGKELRVRFGMNLKFLMGLAGETAVGAAKAPPK